MRKNNERSLDELDELNEEERIVGILNDLKHKLDGKIDIRIVNFFRDVIESNQNESHVCDKFCGWIPITDEKLCDIFNIEMENNKIPHNKLSDIIYCSFDVCRGVLKFDRKAGGIKDKESGKVMSAYWVRYENKDSE